MKIKELLTERYNLSNISKEVRDIFYDMLSRHTKENELRTFDEIVFKLHNLLFNNDILIDDITFYRNANDPEEGSAGFDINGKRFISINVPEIQIFNYPSNHLISYLTDTFMHELTHILQHKDIDRLRTALERERHDYANKREKHTREHQVSPMVHRPNDHKSHYALESHELHARANTLAHNSYHMSAAQIIQKIHQDKWLIYIRENFSEVIYEKTKKKFTKMVMQSIQKIRDGE